MENLSEFKQSDQLTQDQIDRIVDYLKIWCGQTTVPAFLENPVKSAFVVKNINFDRSRYKNTEYYQHVINFDNSMLSLTINGHEIGILKKFYNKIQEILDEND